MAEGWTELAALQLKFALAAQSIQQVSCISQANAHTRLAMKFVCKEKIAEKDLLALEEASVELSTGKKGKTIFRGICSQVRVDKEAEYNEIYLEALSGSVRMDREHNTRTFQDEKKKFSDIAKVVLSKAKGKLEVKPEKAWPELVYQENETDFAFLCRMANTHGMNLYTDGSVKDPQFTAGKAVRQSKKLMDKGGVRLQKDILNYIRVKENVSSEAAAYAFQEEIHDDMDLTIQAGDSISGSPKRVVWRSEIWSDHGIVRNRLLLRPEDGNLPAAALARKMQGRTCYLDGKVLECKETTIRVQFSCDKTQAKDKAMWIPYEPLTGNYFYGMPDVGDMVSVWFCHGGKPIARTSLRDPKKEKKKEVFEPTTRMLISNNKMLRFTPKALEFSSNQKNYGKSSAQSLLQFDNKKGIRLFSTQNVLLQSKDTLRVQASSMILTELDAIMPFFVKEKVGEVRHMAGLGVPAIDSMDDIKSGIGCEPNSVFSMAIKDEHGELPEIIKRIQKELPGGPASVKEAKDKPDNCSYPSDHFVNLFGSKNCVVKVGSSVFSFTSSKASAKASTVYQMGLLPKASGGSGTSLGIKETDDYDDKHIVNFPQCKRNKKDLSSASDITTGAGSADAKEKVNDSVADLERKALKIEAVKKKDRIWALTTKALGSLKGKK